MYSTPRGLVNFMEYGLPIKDKLSGLNNSSVSRKFIILYVTSKCSTMFTRAHVLGHLIPVYTFTPQVSQIHLKITSPIGSLPLHPPMCDTSYTFILHLITVTFSIWPFKWQVSAAGWCTSLIKFPLQCNVLPLRQNRCIFNGTLLSHFVHSRLMIARNMYYQAPQCYFVS
jgi:hypothetical protein